MGQVHQHHHHNEHNEHSEHSGHGHHHHGHHHHELPKQMGRAFLIGIALNLLFVLCEWFFGVASHSLALLADATHNLGDVLGLVMAWGASVLGRRAPTDRFTYGLRGTSILSTLANAMILVLLTGGLAWAAIQRFDDPQPVVGTTVIAVALAGVLVNGISAWLLNAGQQHDMNVRGAYLHMAADAAASLGVAIAGVVVLFTGWTWLDPAVTLALAAVILVGTWSLLRDALKLALQAVPQQIDIDQVRGFLARLPGVTEVHDLHIWGMSTTENAMTAHLVIPQGHPGDTFLQTVAHAIEHDYSIHHVTLQIELADGTACALAPAHVV
ncbi:cation diffusion facilitator family transporter [Ramlibacter sp.]|uniref:cation diffusion facilitator family transporter n=1 Tax=Ramlibacter sp. TaxID=1917967 RepID=UPI00260334B9|nr:cation diffusion facilitator family transporter [Ramlibacter sp.]MDB5954718.1 cation diffusion facilitator family transporter [Ramlibacter sp.]